jgi:hypothetical protein
VVKSKSGGFLIVKYGMVFGKVMVVLIVAGLVLGVMPLTALAKNKALYNKGVEMMIKSRGVMKKAVDTIQKGRDMYVQICTDKGCVADVAERNQKIDDGVNQGRQGLALLDQGQKAYQLGKKKKNAAAAHAGVENMMEGGKTVQAALNTIEEGVKMNNEVLRAKNLADTVEAPTKTILKGTESGLVGIKQFLDGQKLVMENR